jgi:hypothetical protein
MMLSQADSAYSSHNMRTLSTTSTCRSSISSQYSRSLLVHNDLVARHHLSQADLLVLSDQQVAHAH